MAAIKRKLQRDTGFCVDKLLATGTMALCRVRSVIPLHVPIRSHPDLAPRLSHDGGTELHRVSQQPGIGQHRSPKVSKSCNDIFQLRKRTGFLLTGTKLVVTITPAFLSQPHGKAAPASTTLNCPQLCSLGWCPGDISSRTSRSSLGCVCFSARKILFICNLRISDLEVVKTYQIYFFTVWILHLLYNAQSAAWTATQ